MIRKLLQKLLAWVEEPQINIVAPLKYTPKSIEDRGAGESEINDYEPMYQTDGAAGFDIRAYMENGELMKIRPGDTRLIPTGLFVEVPKGYELQIRPRSGLAVKGITVMNTPGTIDSDYRGEIKIILVNHSVEVFTVNDGDRIAQGVVARVSKAKFKRVSELTTKTKRGAGGFGHTGK
jgi:dUTP pyrophosphatase